MRVSVVVAGIILLSLLSLQGCGRKGSLTLPPLKPEAPVSQIVPQSAPQPALSSAPRK